MLIPSQIANNIRSLEDNLFFKNDLSIKEKRIIFYNSIRPLLDWLFDKIKNKYNLEEDEIESELFIYSSALFHKFDKSKSSIIPYLQKYIIFYANKLETKLNKLYLNKSNLVYNRKFSYINEEFYWRPVEILTLTRYVGKIFTKSDKYILNIILELDENNLTKADIAKELSLSVKTTRRLLEDLQEKWRKTCQLPLKM